MTFIRKITIISLFSLVCISLAKPPGFSLDDPNIKARVDKIVAAVCSKPNDLPANKASELGKCMLPPQEIAAVFSKCRKNTSEVPPIGLICHVLTSRGHHGQHGPPPSPPPQGAGRRAGFHECMQQQIEQASESTKKAITDFTAKRSSIEGQTEVLTCMEKAL